MLLSSALRLNPNPDRPDVVAFVGAGGKSSALFRLAAELSAEGRRVITTTTTRMAVEQIRRAPVAVSATQADPPLAALAAALDAHDHVMLIGRETVEQGPLPKRAGVHPAMIDALVARAGELGVSAVLVEADGSRMLPAKAPAAHEPVLPDSTTLLVPVLGLNAIGLPLDAAHLHRPERIRALLDLPVAGRDRLTPARAARLLLHAGGGLKGQPHDARAVFLLNKADTVVRQVCARLIGRLLADRDAAGLAATLARDDASPVLVRYGPAGAVVLAAGRSARMGRPKQLIEIDGVPLLVRSVRTALASDVQQIVVVIGAYADASHDALRAAGLDAEPRLRVVYNPRWPEGQASSVRAGLDGLSPHIEAALFMPVDQPFAPVWLLRRLVRAWEGGARAAAPLVNEALRGAPALFDRSLWPDLQELEGDVGGRVVLRRHAAKTVGIPTGPALLRDLDRPDDLPGLGRILKNEDC